MSFVYDYNDHDDLYEDWRLTYGVAELTVLKQGKFSEIIERAMSEDRRPLLGGAALRPCRRGRGMATKDKRVGNWRIFCASRCGDGPEGSSTERTASED